MNRPIRTLMAILAAALLALGLAHPADVCPGPCGGQHPPVNKAAPPDGLDRAGPEGETVTSSLASIIQEV